MTRICGQHANLLREVFESGCLLGCTGEDQSLLRHGSGVMSHIELFVQDINLRGELGGFLIELTEVGDLPSRPQSSRSPMSHCRCTKSLLGPMRRVRNQAGSGLMGFSSPCPTMSACTYKLIM